MIFFYNFSPQFKYLSDNNNMSLEIKVKKWVNFKNNEILNNFMDLFEFFLV